MIYKLLAIIIALAMIPLLYIIVWLFIGILKGEIK